MGKESAISFLAGVSMQQVRAEQIGIYTGNTTTLGAASATVIFGFNLNEWGVIIGGIVAVVGLVFAQYWQIRRSRREEEIKRAITAALERGAPISVITDDYGNVTAAK